MTQSLDPSFERPNRIPWPPVLLVGVIAAAIGLRRLLPLTWPGVDDAAARSVGLGIGVVGLFLTVWAVITLMRHKTTVMPDQAATQLVGVAELTKNIWFVPMGLLFGALVTWLAILPEERHLEARFGEAWRDYASRTRRLL
jgi:protein-S-isoprenylcysteine O-methyltransferase Ste14